MLPLYLKDLKENNVFKSNGDYFKLLREIDFLCENIITHELVYKKGNDIVGLL